MKYQEYADKINGILAKPDTALAEIGPVLESLKSDLETLESSQIEVAALNDRIRDLQDTNIKLFLSQSGTGTPDEDDVSENDKAVEAFFDEVGKEFT